MKFRYIVFFFLTLSCLAFNILAQGESIFAVIVPYATPGQSAKISQEELLRKTKPLAEFLLKGSEKLKRETGIVVVNEAFAEYLQKHPVITRKTEKELGRLGVNLVIAVTKPSQRGKVKVVYNKYPLVKFSALPPLQDISSNITFDKPPIDNPKETFEKVVKVLKQCRFQECSPEKQAVKDQNFTSKKEVWFYQGKDIESLPPETAFEIGRDDIEVKIVENIYKVKLTCNPPNTEKKMGDFITGNKNLKYQLVDSSDSNFDYHLKIKFNTSKLDDLGVVYQTARYELQSLPAVFKQECRYQLVRGGFEKKNENTAKDADLPLTFLEGIKKDLEKFIRISNGNFIMDVKTFLEQP